MHKKNEKVSKQCLLHIKHEFQSAGVTLNQEIQIVCTRFFFFFYKKLNFKVCVHTIS